MSGLIPSTINNYNLYKDGTKLIGRGEEVTLPTIEWMLATIKAGIGEVELPIVGQLQKMELEIPFTTLSEEIGSAIMPNKEINLTLRASQQGRNADGTLGYQGIKLVAKGSCKKFEPGKTKVGDGMEAKITIGVTNYILEINGTQLVEIDIFNEVCKINGEDLLKDIKALC